MEEIIKKVAELYKRYGIKSVTMDDVARRLSVSKKTLYQHFKDKDDLVLNVVKYSLQNYECEFKKICKAEWNPVELMVLVTKFNIERRKQMHQVLMYDLKKYHPQAWRLLSEYRKEHIIFQLKENIIAGIKDGWYRQNLDIDVVAHLYYQWIELLHDVDFFQTMEFDYSRIIKALLDYHIRGIATPKGVDFYEKVVSKELNEQ